MIYNLSEENSVAQNFISELRSEEIQKDRQRFRKNMERLGEILAYEISKKLNYSVKDIQSSLGVASVPNISDHVVLATVLRAGLALYNGLLNYFEYADNAFISSYRKHHKDGDFEIKLEYVTAPRIENATLILCDPLIATGSSIESGLEALKEFGIPETIHIVGVIASIQSVNYLSRLYPDANIWVCAIDEELTAKSYVVPGLGDAGDLAYGAKT